MNGSGSDHDRNRVIVQRISEAVLIGALSAAAAGVVSVQVLGVRLDQIEVAMIDARKEWRRLDERLDTQIVQLSVEARGNLQRDRILEQVSQRLTELGTRLSRAEGGQGRKN